MAGHFKKNSIKRESDFPLSLNGRITGNSFGCEGGNLRSTKQILSSSPGVCC